MAKIIYSRNRIDPTKISGPYSLLAVMLLVAEILFAIWFYKSQSSIERAIAGSILALVFICLMIFILRMNPTTDKEKTQKNSHFSARMTHDRYILLRKSIERLGFDPTEVLKQEFLSHGGFQSSTN